MPTSRDYSILEANAKYGVMSRAQIQRVCFDESTVPRIVRRRIQSIVSLGLLGRHTLFPFHASLGAPTPCYFLTERGREALAEHANDDRILTSFAQPPQGDLLLHALAVTDTHITLDAAIARQPEVRLESWINEWDTLNAAEKAPERKFRLYTLIAGMPRRLVAVPDAAFLLSVQDHRKVFYLEQDRATSGIRQLSASKTPGYAAMSQQQLHRRHFPDTTIEHFSVLMIAPTVGRRELLRKAFANKPGAALWRFAALPDVKSDTILFAPIWWPCTGGPGPLVRLQANVNEPPNPS